jgi:thiol:disulfide interchange protein
MTSNVRSTLLKAVLAMTFLCMNAVLPSVTAQSAFHVNKSLYSESANAAADIEAAETIARHDHKRILLDFGGNWCGDCQVLDFYYHQAPNAELLAKYYIVVHVDIGHLDHNVNIANRYRVPIGKGVPALAILDASGKLLYSEIEKEFEHTSPEAITAFLKRWSA